MTNSTRRVGVHVALLLGAATLSQLIGALFGDRVPVPVQVLALVTGCLDALFAVGLVLIYRASRVINFAHAGFGGFGAVLMVLLVREQGLPYPLALLAGLAAAGAVGLLAELIFVRRFARSPRLVLTVVTIGISVLLSGVAGYLPRLFGPEEDVDAFSRIDSPISSAKLEWFPAIFTGDHIALVIVTLAAMTALAAFFRFTSVGIAIRAAAENDDRAALLGIGVRSLSSLVWLLAALLSGVAAIMQVPLGGVGAAAAVGVGSSFLLRALAAAVIARMENLPLAVTTALSIAVFEQSIYFAFGRTDIVDVLILLVILVGLLAQRKRLARAQDSGQGTWTASEEIRPVPAELASLPSVRSAGRRVAVGVVIALAAYPWLASPSQTNIGALFAIYGIVAVSLVVLIGWGGQVSLGQWAFVAVGAAVGGGLTSHWNVWFPLAALIASLVGAGFAVLLGLPALRIRGLFLAVTTLAFALVTSSVLLNQRYFGWLLPDTVGRPKFAFINTEDERAYYYLCVLALAAAVWAAKGLRSSRTGRVLIAMRDNERAAQSFSINLVRTRLATFAMSGFIAAFAGVLYAHHQHAVSPNAFQPEVSVTMFLMAVIGGLGSVTGVLMGPIYLGLAQIWLPAELRFLATAGGVLFVLLFVPRGLGALVYGMRDSYLRRVAIRNKIFVPSLLADYRTDAHMTRTPLAPKSDADGNEVELPRHYRLASRIGAVGKSQAGERSYF